MRPKCSEDQLEAGGQQHSTEEKHHWLIGERKKIKGGVTICKGNVGVYMTLSRVTFDCTAPQSPQIRPILMGYLGFQS